jgi:hypothetical protein
VGGTRRNSVEKENYKTVGRGFESEKSAGFEALDFEGKGASLLGMKEAGLLRNGVAL